MSTVNLAELDKRATSGVWGQFSTQHGPWKREAMAWYKEHGWKGMDSSHDVSTLTDRGPKSLAHFTHADDAAFAETLVNEWRAGRIVQKDP